MSHRYVALAPHAFASRRAKTAHGVIAYAADPTVAVIDPDHAGRRVRDVLPHLNCDAPIVATLAEARAFAPTTLLLGTAPTGGRLPEAWRAVVREALASGLHVLSGLHEALALDAEFAEAARIGGATISDVRFPGEMPIFTGAAYDLPATIVLTVGSDCNSGKMTTCLELQAAARASGVRAAFAATGQTGVMIAGRGVAIDRVIADFASGAAEHVVCEAASDADLVFVEGQGGINHPAYAPVTLALMFGAAPDALVLVHDASRTRNGEFGTPLLSLPHLIRLHEEICASVKPAAVVAVALNTAELDADAARAAVAEAERETGLPCADVVRDGPHELYARIASHLQAKTRPNGSAGPLPRP